jgi:hypothetical protein
VNTPLSLLEINHRSGHKEAMAAGGRSDASDIKMWSTGIGLFNGLVGVTCAGLFQALAVKGGEWSNIPDCIPDR